MAFQNGLFYECTRKPYQQESPRKLFDISKGSRDFIRRMKLESKLKVHNGCVNTICWNSSGNWILSGSDDQHLNITDPFSNKAITSIVSGHRANIFSAKFIPNTSDNQLVSCSGDGMIHHTVVDREDQHGTCSFNCHFGTAYEVITAPQDCNSFLSCGEDGTVRWYDLRLKQSCSKEDCKEDIMINCRRAVTSIEINPMLPYQLAVGCSDSSVRIFDRRMLGTRALGNFSAKGTNGLVSCFSAPLLEGKPHRITCLQYNYSGQQLLVNYSSEHLYLFDMMEDGRKQKKLQATESSPSLASKRGRPPPIKRLRLRGDWSDTGPNARPERERGRPEANETEAERSAASIMHRMSDMLTRWLDGAARESGRGGQAESAEARSTESQDAISQEENQGDRTEESSVNVLETPPIQPSSGTSPNDSEVQTAHNEPDQFQDLVVDQPESERSETVEAKHNVKPQMDESGSCGNVVESKVTEKLGERRELSENLPQFLNEKVEDFSKEPIDADLDSGAVGGVPLPGLQPFVVKESDDKMESESVEIKVECLSEDDSMSLPSHSPAKISVDSQTSQENVCLMAKIDTSVSCQATPAASDSDVSPLCTGVSEMVCDSNVLPQDVTNQTPCTEKHSDSNESQKIQNAQSSSQSVSQESTSESLVGMVPVFDLQYRSEGTSNSTIQLGFSNENESQESLLGTDMTGTRPKGGATVQKDNPQTFSDQLGRASAQDKQSDIPQEPEHSASTATNSESKSESAIEVVVPSTSTTSNESDEVTRTRERGTASGRQRRIGHSGPPTGNFQLPGSSDSSDDEGSDNELMRTSSRTSNPRESDNDLQRNIAALKLQELYKKRQEEREREEQELKNLHVPGLKMEYRGHRNARTMIKEACFWGDKFVMSGSDCGHIFIWDRETAEVVMLLEGDKHVVNCLQPHPFYPVLASSGIDYDVKIWSPCGEDSDYDAEKAEEVISRNEVMLEETRDTITVPASFMLRMLASLNHIRAGRRGSNHAEGSSSSSTDEDET